MMETDPSLVPIRSDTDVRVRRHVRPVRTGGRSFSPCLCVRPGGISTDGVRVKWMNQGGSGRCRWMHLELPRRKRPCGLRGRLQKDG